MALCDILYKHLRNTLTYLLTYLRASVTQTYWWWCDDDDDDDTVYSDSLMWRIIVFFIDEDVDNEEVYKMAAVMSQCGGLKIMLKRFLLFRSLFVTVESFYCDFSWEIILLS